MKNLLKILAILLLLFSIVGCGGDNASSSKAYLVVETKNSILNEQQNEMNLNFTIQNHYKSNVSVNLHDLAINVAPCSVRQTIFSPSEILFSETLEQREIQAVVTFDRNCTPTSYIIEGVTTLEFENKSNNISFISSSKDINPELNGTIIPTPRPDDNVTDRNDTNGSIDTIRYGIKFTIEDETPVKFNLEDKNNFKVSLVDRTSGSYIPNNQIDKITVTSKQPKLLKLFDDGSNTIASERLVYENKNYNTVYIQTYTYSGLADIDVRIEYRNRKGNEEVLEKTYSTVVLSGPPTAFSINSAGVSYNFDTKWFENKFLISAVDRYNNVVNISPTIYVSAMTGFAKDSKGDNVLYGNFGNVEGTLNVDKDSKIATFEANSSVFDNIDVNRDYLYVFGKVDDYEALGKWDIDSYESSHSDTTLLLSEAFNGENHDKLGFALGHNYLVDPGSSASAEWQVKIDSTDGEYKLDEEGKAFVTLKFPVYLVGKRVALAVNFLGKTPETGKILRSGEVKFQTLHSFDGVKSPKSITVDAFTDGVVYRYRRFYIDTGTNDIWSVLNSHVNCLVTTSNLSVVSRSVNRIVDTVDEFREVGGYGAYVRYGLSINEHNKSGTLNFQECQVSGLPRF